MAIIGSPRVSSYVIVDAVGLEVPDHPVVDFFSLTPAQVARRSYHNPDRYGIDPSTLPPEAQRARAGNRQTLAVYGGQAMIDPGLAARLATIRTPTLVVWGEADRIADPEYGHAYANAIPGAEYALLTETGHLPQIETPQKLIDTVWAFADRHAAQKPAH
jgi:pimeloyl-ACP methyl ester carboxylesterase